MSRPAGPDWTPSVSVVVPTYNRARPLEACVASLLSSEYPLGKFEVIVVDNGSVDGTRDALAPYGTRIRVVDEAVRGPAAARNAGVREASGEVIAFTDSDCVVATDWLRRIVAPLIDPGVGAAGGRILAFPGGNHVEHFGERIHDHRKAIEQVHPPYAITMNLAARASVIRSIGLFNERLLRCEDVDLAYRLVQSGYRLVYADDAVIWHRNRRTLPALFREAFLHGYYAVALRRLHRAWSESVAAAPRSAAPRSARQGRPTTYSRDLAPWRRTLYAGVFRLGKACGRAGAAWRRVS